MRTRITWLVCGAVGALLVLAGVDAIRSEGSKTAAPTASVRTATPIATDSAWGSSAPIRQYVMAADAICAGASADLMRRGLLGGGGMARIAWWNGIASRTAERTLGQLRALPAPEADQDLIDDFYAGADGVIDALRQVAAAASAGDRQRMKVLIGKQIEAIHRKDARADELSAQWHVENPEILRACPVSLPA